MSISRNIRELRKKHNMSQEFVAEKLGYKSFTTIQKWESGVSEPPMKKAKELATLFNVDLDKLVGDVPSSPAAAPALSPDREELLANYDKLNDEGKQDARKYVKLLGNSPEYTEDAEDTGNGNITA